MKKKILFNIAFIIEIIFTILILITLISFLEVYIREYNGSIDQPSQNLEITNTLLSSIIRFVIYTIFCVFSILFSIFMLVYINKNDIKELTVPVVQNVKESLQKKAEEKKQQQIQALEEKLNQLKKDDK